MLVNTHMLIGQKVYENVQSLLNIRLNKKSFIYGNIKPDIVHSLSSRSHLMKDSLDFVIDEINRLMSPVGMRTKQFSTDLGVINHFLSDFFCSPHYYYDEGYNKFFTHINYEYALHRRFVKLDRKGILDLSRLKIDHFRKGDIVETILNVENMYKKQRSSIENDICSALRISTIASLYIIEGSFLSVKSKKIELRSMIS